MKQILYNTCNSDIIARFPKGQPAEQPKDGAVVVVLPASPTHPANGPQVAAARRPNRCDCR